MRIAIVHYHLRPGGVTRVIESSSRALSATGTAHVILTGEAPVPGDGAADVPYRVVPGLGYSGHSGGGGAAELTSAMRRAAREALGAAPDIWHFHNHSLGKNALLGEVVAGLAGGNERIVLQIHDLAEDGRPANHRLIAGHSHLYPSSAQVRYAFVNSRDLARFLDIGLPPSQASLLENPVAIPPNYGHEDQTTSGPPLLLYPVRGIRRKNLGELLLLSAIAPQGARCAITRAPDNPQWLEVHDAWRDFARKHRLPVEFQVVGRIAPAAGANCSFAAWRMHATHFISTSVAEGFGFTFLDALAHGKRLIARNLPHLTRNHKDHGIPAGCNYDRIAIPAGIVDPELVHQHVRLAVGRIHRAYGRTVPPDAVDLAYQSLHHDGCLDFGNLPAFLQQQVIESVLENPADCGLRMHSDGRSLPAAEWLSANLRSAPPLPLPSLLDPWSPAAYQRRLLQIYSNLAGQPATATGHLDPDRLLDLCLDPASFHFLLGA